MLTADDTPTIRFALHRRLDKEPGVQVADIKFAKLKKGDWYADLSGLMLRADEPFIRVGVVLSVGRMVIVTSRFDLPDPFEHGHLLAEIDEIAEQCRRARKDFFTAAMDVSEAKPLPGTGLRGKWNRYGFVLGKQ